MWECSDGRQRFQGGKKLGSGTEGASGQEHFSLYWRDGKHNEDRHLSRRRAKEGMSI